LLIKICDRKPAFQKFTEMLMVAKIGSESFAPSFDDNVLELSLMLSRRQFDLLEQRAHAERMSVAQFLRRLVQDSISQEPVGQAEED
jgi:hypothetical protein